LLVRDPTERLDAGTITSPVSLVDIYPRLLNTVGIDAPKTNAVDLATERREYACTYYDAYDRDWYIETAGGRRPRSTPSGATTRNLAVRERQSDVLSGPRLKRYNRIERRGPLGPTPSAHDESRPYRHDDRGSRRRRLRTTERHRLFGTTDHDDQSTTDDEKWLFRSYADETDVGAVTDVIQRGTWRASGPEIEAFERKMATSSSPIR